jgi:predicted  nucleic acid-binding Zn-ribbon protein
MLSIATGAYAQAMYKSTMPDGRVVYGEKPETGAKRVDKVEAPPPQTGTTVLTPAEKQTIDQRIQKRVATDEAQKRELENAHAQLKKAQAALEAGKEPLPGERQGTAGGFSRLTDEYWARQKNLEAAVAAARKRVEQAEQAARR